MALDAHHLGRYWITFPPRTSQPPSSQTQGTTPFHLIFKSQPFFLFVEQLSYKPKRNSRGSEQPTYFKKPAAPLRKQDTRFSQV